MMAEWRRSAPPSGSSIMPKFISPPPKCRVTRRIISFSSFGERRVSSLAPLTTRCALAIKLARAWVAAASLLAASALSAQPPSPNRDPAFCAELQRAIRAVERGRVAALERSRARPPSFGFIYGCTAQGSGWFCHQALARPSLSIDNLVAQISACLPGAARLPGSQFREVDFVVRGVRLRIEETGGREARAGRIVTFSIEPQ